MKKILTLCAVITFLGVLLLYFGRRYESRREILTGALLRADRVNMIEHSDVTDFDMAKHRARGPLNSHKYVSKEYLRRTLNDAEITSLIAAINRAPAEEAATACIPAYHHTLEIVGLSTESELKICFLCGKLEWNGERWNALNLVSELSDPVEKLGYDASRSQEEWTELFIEGDSL